MLNMADKTVDLNRCDEFVLECDVCDGQIYRGEADPDVILDVGAGLGGLFENSGSSRMKGDPDDTSEVEGSCENCDTELHVIDPVEGDDGELYCSINCLNEAYQ